MSLPQAVDWLKCTICQKEIKEKTQCSGNSKRHDLGAGYLTTERVLTSFHEARELNLVVGWEKLDDLREACTMDINSRVRSVARD